MHTWVENYYFHTMVDTVVLLTLLPALVTCSGEGNIRLLEDEVAVALKSCTYPNDNSMAKEVNDRQRRSENTFDGSQRIDDNLKQANQYSHERRNTTVDSNQMQVFNGTENDYDGNGSGNMAENLLTSVPQSAIGGINNGSVTTNIARAKRSEPLFNKPDTDQCLSQCVFANLQVVDSRGIPREAELWNKIQSSVTSQQSRSAIRDQIRACFQELQSEAEDNGCSYSNKLERCLMLRFLDRKAINQSSTEKPATS